MRFYCTDCQYDSIGVYCGPYTTPSLFRFIVYHGTCSSYPSFTLYVTNVIPPTALLLSYFCEVTYCSPILPLCRPCAETRPVSVWPGRCCPRLTWGSTRVMTSTSTPVAGGSPISSCPQTGPALGSLPNL